MGTGGFVIRDQDTSRAAEGAQTSALISGKGVHVRAETTAEA